MRVLCRIAKLELFQINSQHEIALVGHGITTGPAWHSPAGPFLLGFHPKPRPTFVKFTCARPLLIINKLHPLNCAGGTNLCPPATSQKVNHLIINELSKRAVAGEFHGAQAWRFAVKGACAGLTMSQSMLTRCVRRTVCGSGQAWHPRLRAGGAARDGAAGPCGGTIGVEGLECQRLAAVRDSTECCAPAPDLQSEQAALDRGMWAQND